MTSLSAGTLAPAVRWGEPRAAYVHVPFFAHKCGYCDFASLAGFDHLAERYLDALEREMELATEGTPRSVETVFIGGGTPTRLDASGLSRLLESVRRWFPLSTGGEWTVEANPGTLDAEKADVLVEGGVNRVSLGRNRFNRRCLPRWSETTSPTTSGSRWISSARAFRAGRST